MKLPMFREVLSQSVKKPATNLFPAPRLPDSITGFLDLVANGKAEIIPPVPTPLNYRGKIQYDRNTCIGCGLCLKVCPAHAIEQVVYPPVKVTVTDAEGKVSEKMKTEKRIRIYVSSCIFCGQCTDICPKDSLSMSDAFLLATVDRFSDEQVVE